MRGKPLTIPLSLPYIYTNPLGAHQGPILIPPTVNAESVDEFLGTRSQYIAMGTNDPGEVHGVLGWLSGDGTTQRIFAMSTTALWRFASPTWTSGKGVNPDLTGASNVGYCVSRYSNLSGSVGDAVIATNNADKPIYWDYSAASWSTITNAPTKAQAVACLGGRVIFGNVTEGGTLWGSRVRWSALNDYTTYPALAYADLIDTADNIVAINVLNRTVAIVYKERSAWLMTSTGGSDAAAFRFEILGIQPGPMGVNGISDGPQGTHHYLGRDGNIYMCDGTRVKRELSTSSLLAKQLNPAFSRAIDSGYSLLNEEMHFLVPNNAAIINTALAYNTRTKTAYYHTFPNSVTAIANMPGQAGDERVVLCHNNRMVWSTFNEVSPTDLTAGAFDLRILLPTAPASEWEIEGVDITLTPAVRTDSLKVSWMTGQSLDALTESTPQVFFLNGVARIQANLTVGLRARCVVLRLLQDPAPCAIPIQLSRIDAFAWQRAQAI
jgi:hypothetical protein